jgi:hypothetical protein
MREKFNQLIISCSTLTVPASETKSIGLAADALVPCFLLDIWTTLFGRENSHPSTGTLQKLIPILTQTATIYTTGPLAFKPKCA